MNSTLEGEARMNARGLTGIPTLVLGTAVFLNLMLMAPSGASAQTSRPPVISLKAFTSVPEWVLDITWHAKDVFEDRDSSAGLELTATARFYLKQSDKTDAWGRWHVERAHSANLVMKSFLINKNDHSRTEWNPTGSMPDAGAIFEVGGKTPGYQLIVNAAFPVKILNPLMGSMDSIVTLQTNDVQESPPVFCSGPLPAAGKTISGSLVILSDVPPFGAGDVSRTRLGIQYVLRPLAELAPLVPKS
jgi:hypothetical protein